MGRWASNAALMYYRHEEDVLLRAVSSTAFQYHVTNPSTSGAGRAGGTTPILGQQRRLSVLL